jgi:iron transport multicopper oxidase
VQYGKRYRFRLISLACDPNYIFSIEGHNFTIIEADAVDTQSVEVNAVQIFAAQRYSFILNASQPIDNYWIRAQPDHGADTSFNNGVNSAILRYVGAPVQEPTDKPLGPGSQLDLADLHPLDSSPPPGGPALGDADHVIPLPLGFNFTSGQFLVNNVTFINPTVPVLLQILSGAQSAHDLLPSGSVYTLPPNKTIELVLMGGNAPGGPHPFHLHGVHSFHNLPLF